MDAVAQLAPTPTRAQLVELEHAISRQLAPVEYETIHTHAPGLYVRTVRMPAGAVATGRVHSTEHVFVVTRGELTIAAGDGSPVQRVAAGVQCISKPGVKRAVFCHTDVECSNVHITSETDLARLEAELVEPIDVDLELDLEHQRTAFAPLERKPCLT